MQIIFEPEKGLAAKTKYETETLPAAKKRFKQRAYLSVLTAFALGLFILTPFISWLFFLPNLPSLYAGEFQFTKANLIQIVLSFVLSQGICFGCWYLFKAEEPDWGKTCPAAAEYYMAIQNKNLLNTKCNGQYNITLTLEHPDTHIVTEQDIYIADFRVSRRTDIKEKTIDLHKESIYLPYPKE